jgi:hypothetical protein
MSTYIPARLKGRFDMRSNRTRLVGVAAAALSAIAIAGPVSSADAATSQGSTVTGPAIISAVPTTFVNLNIQVSAGDSVAGQQSAAGF